MRQIVNRFTACFRLRAIGLFCLATIMTFALACGDGNSPIAPSASTGPSGDTFASATARGALDDNDDSDDGSDDDSSDDSDDDSSDDDAPSETGAPGDPCPPPVCIPG